MALPYVFANVAQLNTPELDAVFNALGALVTIPCTATGTNTIALTVAANTPTVSAYTTGAPQFAFVAAATSNGAVTVAVGGLGAKKLYKNNGAVQAGSGDIVSGLLYTMVYNAALDSAVGGFALTNQSISVIAPTVQKLTATSGTYTLPAGVIRINVRMVGNGGGGGAQATNNGVNGSASSFKDWICNGGLAGPVGSGSTTGGAGGTGGANGTGTLVDRRDGNRGGPSQTGGLANPGVAWGGMTAMYALSGVPNSSASTGGSAPTNSGGGGAGGGTSATAFGGGGGGGEYAQFWMTAAQVGASCSYALPVGGTGGVAGTVAGGNGAAGCIIVEEYYI